MEQFMFKKILILLCVQTFLMITSDLIYAQDYIKLIKKDNSEINFLSCDQCVKGCLG